MADNFPEMGGGGGGNDGNGGAPRQRQGRGDRDGGTRDARGSNAAVHSGVAFGFIKELIEMQAADLGAAGYATEWTQNLLQACEKLFGIGATENVVFPGLSALISNSGFFRNILKVALPNDFLSDVVIESIDGYVEGVRTAYHQGGSITRKHHDDAMVQARQIIKKKMDQRTVADVLFTLTEAERDRFNQLYHVYKARDPKELELFNFYRTKMNRREVIMDVLRIANENFLALLPYLETLYGLPPKPSKVEGIGHKVVEALEGFGKRLTKPATPEQQADRATKRTAKQAEIDAINASRRTSRH